MDKEIIKLKNIKNSTKNFFSKEIFKGFTLVEVVTILTIVSVMAGLSAVAMIPDNLKGAVRSLYSDIQEAQSFCALKTELDNGKENF